MLTSTLGSAGPSLGRNFALGLPWPPLDAFAADPQSDAGRIVPAPATVTPSDGAAVFCLGHDRGDLVEFFAPGNYAEVAQAGSLPAGNLLTFQARTRAARVLLPPAPYGWTASVLIDGVVVGTRSIASGAQVDWEWYVALSLAGGPHTIALRLTLVGPPMPGPPALPVFELGVPAFYVDNLRFLTGVPFITNEVPVANQGQGAGTPPPASTSIAFDVFGLGQAVDPSSLAMTLNGADVLVAGAVQPGFSASVVAAAFDLMQVTVQPGAVLTSAEIVTVRATASVGGSPVTRTWTFQVVDTTTPAMTVAQVLAPKQVRITWTKALSIVDPAGAHDGLNPALYTLTALQPDADTPAVRGASDSELSPRVASIVIVQDNPSVIDLMTDVELTPGVAYQVRHLGVADLLGNFDPVGLALAPGFVLPWPDGRVFDLLRWLPRMNRQEDVTHDLVRFVRCLQEPANLLLYDIDQWTDILDVDVALEPELDAMLVDLGNPFPFILSIAQKRQLVRTLATIYQSKKGTGPGIVDVVRFLLGLTVTITGYTGDTMALGVSELGGDGPPPGTDPAYLGSWILGPGSSWALYAFRVVSAVPLSDVQLAQVAFIANYMKPAHTHLVEIVLPTTVATYDPVELGVSELGIDWLLHS